MCLSLSPEDQPPRISQRSPTYPSFPPAAPTGLSLSSRFAEEETEAQGSEMICPKSHSQPAVGLEFEPKAGALPTCTVKLLEGRLCLYNS